MEAIQKRVVIKVAITVIVLIGAIVAISYGALLYSSCQHTGTINVPIIQKEIICRQHDSAKGTEGIQQQDDQQTVRQQEYLKRLSQAQIYDLRTTATLSDKYNVRLLLVPNDTSEKARNILDQYRAESAAMLERIKFPPVLIEGIVVGIVSPIYNGGLVVVKGKNTEYNLPAKGAHGITFEDGSIFIYGDALAERFLATLAHELGHIVSRKFTTADWVEWSSIRGTKDTQGILGTEWEQSVEEDFAEEFKRYAGGYKGEPNIWENQTAWGEGGYFYRELGFVETITPASAEVQAFITERLEEHLHERNDLNKLIEQRKRSLIELQSKLNI